MHSWMKVVHPLRNLYHVGKGIPRQFVAYSLWQSVAFPYIKAVLKAKKL